MVTDDDVLDRFTDDVRRPKAAIGVLVEQVFIHCAKAFRRSHLWQPETWAALADAPDGADILVCQSLAGDYSADQIRAALGGGLRVRPGRRAPDQLKHGGQPARFARCRVRQQQRPDAEADGGAVVGRVVADHQDVAGVMPSACSAMSNSFPSDFSDACSPESTNTSTRWSRP